MPDYEALASADYVIDGYVEAHDELQRHRETGSEAALRRAAAALCRALTLLETDDAFWNGIEGTRAPTATRGLPDGLTDVDALLGVERDVLIEAGVPPGSVDEILRDAGVALREYSDWPDEFAAERVREALATAARAACTDASFRQSRTLTRRLRRAALAGAGATIIVANGKAAPPGLQDLSIVVGEIVIVYSAFEAE